jgi:hypothetical protein
MAVQYVALQCSTVQDGAELYSTVIASAVQMLRSVQCIPVQYGTGE